MREIGCHSTFRKEQLRAARILLNKKGEKRVSGAVTESENRLAWLQRDDALNGGVRAAAAATAAFAALLLNLLLFQGYPAARPEVLCALMILVCIALLYGLVYAAAHRWLRAFLEGLLIAVLLDANGAPSPWPVATGLAVLGFVLWRHRSILPFVMIAALVAGLASLAGVGSRQVTITEKRVRSAAPEQAKLPAILHIILDEHGGLDGMPQDNPRSREVRAAIERFYLGNGFRLFSKAHSDFAYTLNSVPQILNFGQAQEPGSSKEVKQKVKKTAYFDLLAKRGYSVKVYQSEFLDMCGSEAVAYCLTYQSQSMAPIAPADLSLASKTGIILQKLTSRSLRKAASTLYKGLRSLGVSLPFYDMADIRLNPVNAALAFDRVNRDLAQAKPGEVYFAHILLPHSPFGLTSDCRIREGAWVRRQRPGPVHPRQDAGYDQVLCALRKTEAAFRAISRSAAGANFIMLVHGDHGSRTTDEKPIAKREKHMDDAEKLANFSALFAVHAPTIEKGVDATPASLADLVGALARSQFTTIDVQDRPGPAVVFLDDEKHIPRKKISLPEGW